MGFTVFVMKSGRAMMRQLETPLNVHGNLKQQENLQNLHFFKLVLKTPILSVIFRHFGADPLGNGCGHPTGVLPKLCQVSSC